ncbi:uracil-DNA glycosylase [[Mycoplasma] gypis]|uniref:uracil-DNA glycosylase n=1 Tax=[Mycoplasma] gypis TaxID=92404 RepID=A0ABZ2RT34_9BACT|nr:uracil-DNA glycosylase [[Mycoplasma] gypis]MBN0919026.1 uracil-DNA glycosylase [[Mycoplasma] gypis]
MKFNFQDFLQNQKQEKYFQNIEYKINQNISKITPKIENIYNAYDLDFDNLKVIIIGQDPYYQPLVADGLAFSSKLNKTPSSLKNIFKEIQNCYPESTFETNSLRYWKQQGVLLLNTYLTTFENEALACKDWNWDIFVLSSIKQICQNHKNIVFLLLGNFAQKFIKPVEKQYPNNLFLKTSHPSGLSCYRGFIGSNIFKQANNYLIQKNKNPIDWSTKLI